MALGSPQLTPLAPSLLLLLPDHPWVPGTFLEPQEVPSSLPCSQIALLAPRASLGPWSKLGVSWSEPNVILGPWIPGTFLDPQKAPSLLPLLPACSPCSQRISGSLEPSWGLRKPPACSPCSQLTPLAPRASLGLWNLSGTSESPQLASLGPSSLPLAHRASLGPLSELGVSWSELEQDECYTNPQLAPLALSLLPLLPACSPCSQSIPGSLEPRSQWPMNSLVCIGVPTTSGGQGARGQGGSKLKLAPLTPRSLSLLQLSPSLLQFAPAHSQLALACSPCSSLLQITPLAPSSLPMANEQFSMYWDPHHLWGLGGKLQQAGERGARWEQPGVRGASLEQGE